MPYPNRSPAELREIFVALGRALFPELGFSSRRSYHGKKATFLAGALGHVESHAATAQNELHPLTAPEGVPLDKWCRAVGVQRKDATPARKAASGRVRGAAGELIEAGWQMRHPETGLLFEVANLSDVVIPGSPGTDGYYDVDIAGVSTGSQTRLPAGTTLEFLAAPAVIESQVVLQLDLDEDGFDAEAFGSQRQRFLATFSETPAGGTDSDFVRWCREAIPQVAKAWAFPVRGGAGSMDVAAFYNGTGAARALSSDDRQAVLDYIRLKAPFHVAASAGALRVLTTIPDARRVEILVEPDGRPAFLFQWLGSAEVLAWNPATRELQFSAPIPSSMRPGHFLTLVGTVGGSGVDAHDGRQCRVESFSAADKVILAPNPAPTVAPAAGDLAYPGGPLVDPLRRSIIAHMNGQIIYAGRGKVPIPEEATNALVQGVTSIIGLDILVAGIGPSNPGRKYGSWQGGLTRANLATICGYKAGVGDIEILSPSVDYMPLDDGFPMQHQIHYIAPGPVIVRPA